MMKKGNKGIVIDASVSFSASYSNAPVSTACRVLLDKIHGSDNYMVMTPAIWSEWKKHQKSFAIKWRAAMVARKRVIMLPGQVNPLLRQSVSQTSSVESHIAAMDKDMHLVEASLEADKIVISLDERVRNLFALASVQVRLLGDIVWVNPINPHELCVEWIENGCKMEHKRRLGYYGK